MNDELITTTIAVNTHKER